MEFTEEHFTEKYGLKPGEFRVRSAVSTEEPPSLEFSAPKEAGDIAEKARKRLDSAITDMRPAALKASRALVAEVENAVDKAGSFDELKPRWWICSPRPCVRTLWKPFWPGCHDSGGGARRNRPVQKEAETMPEKKPDFDFPESEIIAEGVTRKRP